jgi:hypothetical protein
VGTQWIGVFKTIGTIIGMFLTNKYGRKFILLWGYGLAAVTIFLTSAFMYFKNGYLMIATMCFF